MSKRDLIQMLPRFYDDAPEVDGIMNANSMEIERIRTQARDLLSQITVETATWGLSDWERVLELSPRPNEKTELRRARILAKMRGTTPATVANMLAIINAHVPNRNATIDELPEPGVIDVMIPVQNDIELDELNADLNIYKPAHLAFQISAILEDVIELIGNEYTFEVPFLICNAFRTDDAQGIGVPLLVGGESFEYTFDVPFLVCGEFYPKEAY